MWEQGGDGGVQRGTHKWHNTRYPLKELRASLQSRLYKVALPKLIAPYLLPPRNTLLALYAGASA